LRPCGLTSIAFHWSGRCHRRLGRLLQNGLFHLARPLIARGGLAPGPAGERVEARLAGRVSSLPPHLRPTQLGFRRIDPTIMVEVEATHQFLAAGGGD
jgi:hypothetical protein